MGIVASLLLPLLVQAAGEGPGRVLVERLGGPDRGAAARAAQVLLDGDRTELEAFARALDDLPAPRLRLVATCIRALPREPGQVLLPLLDARDAAVQGGALRLMVELRAWRALALAHRHASERVRMAAARGLRGHAAEVQDLLASELRHVEGPALDRAFAFVAALGADGAEAMATLLAEPAWFARVSTALHSLGAPGFVALLRRWSTLDDEQRGRLRAQWRNRPDRARRILRGILRFGPIDAAVTAVVLLAETNDRTSLDEALELGRLPVRKAALACIADRGVEAVPTLARALRDRSPELRELALRRLCAFGPAAHTELAALLDGGDLALRLAAVRALVAAGGPGLRALAEARAAGGRAALDALRPAIRPLLAELEPGLAAGLGGDDPVASAFAVELAAELGAWDLLVHTRLELGDPEQRALVRLAEHLDRALARAEGAPVPALLRALDLAAPADRGPCLALLSALGPQALPALVRALSDEELRAPATRALRDLDLGLPAGPGR